MRKAKMQKEEYITIRNTMQKDPKGEHETLSNYYKRLQTSYPSAITRSASTLRSVYNSMDTYTMEEGLEKYHKIEAEKNGKKDDARQVTLKDLCPQTDQIDKDAKAARKEESEECNKPEEEHKAPEPAQRKLKYMIEIAIYEY